MLLRVLGSAAGGGYPQWNCNCRMCSGVRTGALRAQPRTQSSLAVSEDGASWILINASPDLRQQIEAHLPLHGAGRIRSRGLRNVLLADAQIDHTSGLLFLRESVEPLRIFCTERVREDLTRSYPLLAILESYCGVELHTVGVVGESFTVPGFDTLEFQAVPLRGKAPPYSPHRGREEAGDNVAFAIKDRVSGKTAVYAPGLAEIDERLSGFMRASDLLLVDGTTYTDDEMITSGCGRKTAASMGHMALSGETGMLRRLAAFPSARRVLVHINNTNPILDEDSDERRAVEASGVEVAVDGLTITL